MSPMEIKTDPKPKVQTKTGFIPTAHLSWGHDPTKALCGAKILGVDAWEPFQKCEACEAIAREASRDD